MDKRIIKIGLLEIELPNYMITLDQPLIDEVCAGQDVGIVASGTHPDGKVTIITSKGEVRSFDANNFTIPPGLYIPMPDGKEVHLPSNENRWPGYSRGFFVKSDWLIENSTPEMGNATLQVNNRYVSDISITSLEATGT